MSKLVFSYVKFSGRKVNPESFGDREPSYEEICRLYSNHEITVSKADYVTVRIRGIVATMKKGRGEEKFEETLWLSKETYDYAKHILAPTMVYYTAREGVSFSASKGAWMVIGEPEPVKCPPGHGGECVRVETELSSSLGLDPFIIERDFIFKGYKGEHISKGKITGYTYVILAFDKDRKSFLPEEELKKTLLYKNYLSRNEVRNILRSVSKHMRKEWWHVERMREEALASPKVVWRDVAKEFIPAIDAIGAVPDYTVNYVVVDTLEEAFYLLAVLLAPQINSVVRELSPWIGHVQPRFLRYFRIPKYNPGNPIHKEIMRRGRDIYNAGDVTDDKIKAIESLIERI